MNKATCNNCRWYECPIRKHVDTHTYSCDEWEHYTMAVPTCGDDIVPDSDECVEWNEILGL